MKTACFTGHRNLNCDLEDLKSRVYNALERAIVNAGITEFYPDFATYKVEMKYDNQLNLSKIRQNQKNTAKKQEGWHMTTNLGSR